MDSDKKQKRKAQRHSNDSSESMGGGAMGCFGVCMGPSAFGGKK